MFPEQREMKKEEEKKGKGTSKKVEILYGFVNNKSTA